MSGPDPLKVEIQADTPDADQPAPRTEGPTGPPPFHDPFLHGIGGAPDWTTPQQERPAFQAPPRPPSNRAPLRGDKRRIHDKITQTYAMVGIMVCAGAETRMQTLGTQDPFGQPRNTDRERQRRATALMNQAGQGTVQLAPALADAWMEVADEIPAVKRALEAFSEGGAVLGLVMAHAMMLIPYGVAMGWVPEVIGERLAGVSMAMGAAAGMDAN